MTASRFLSFHAGIGGWGDALQDARIIPYIAPHWPDTTLATRTELVRLISRLGLPVVALAALEQLDPVPYLYSPFTEIHGAHLPQFEHMRLPSLWADESVQFNPDRTRLQIGLCWHGSGGGRSAAGLDDDWRCIPPELLLPLLEVPDVQFTALQFTDHAQHLQALPVSRGIASLSDLGVYDFAGTAGIMKRLDLVITIDTSVAHLAGNLRVPTWLMLVSPKHSGWDGGRWGCTLYSSVRQFRQPTPGDWSKVIAAVTRELKARVTSQKP